MCEVRLLNKGEYLYLKSRLGFFFENELSDYAKLFISMYIPLKGENGIDGLSPYYGLEEERDRDISYFWLDSETENVVTFTNRVRKLDETSDDIGVKVLQDFNELEDVIVKRKYNNHRICTWGEYPQTRATLEDSNKLDKLLKLGFLGITGNVYTFNQNYISSTNPEYEYLVEYEADDKKYVHLYELIDGKPKSLWIEVEPVEWIVDNKTNIKPRKENKLLEEYIDKLITNGILNTKNDIFYL